MALFDMPGSRSNRQADIGIAKKSKTKSASAVTTRGTSLLDKIQIIKQTVDKNLGKYSDNYDLVCDEKTLSDYVDSAIKSGYVSIDTETTGLDPMSDVMAGFGLYTPGRKGIYVPVNHVSAVTGIRIDGQLSPDAAKRQIRRLSESNVKIIMHNANFDIRVIGYATGVWLHCYFDSYIASCMLNENEPHGLKELHQKYVLDGVGDAWSFGKLFKDIPFTLIPVKTAYLYAARDPHITFELYEFQIPYLTRGTKENEEQGLQKVADVFWDIEMPYIDVVVQMENTGIAFDFDYQVELHDKYTAIKEEKMENFYRELENFRDKIQDYIINHKDCKLSNPINIASPSQLAILLYDIIGVESVDRKNPRGTGEEILKTLNLPLCNSILEYRGVDKLLSTYIDKLPSCVNKTTNRIHGNFNQCGAKTGRLSSDNPNMQNIPSHNTDIRKLFKAADGCVIMSSDYSQQEPKCMAAMCGDEGLIQSYIDGKDLYAQIASASFDVPYEECMEFRPDGSINKAGKERRNQAKTILLGTLYGRGIQSIAEQLKCDVVKAQQIHDKVFIAFPAIKKFEEDTIIMAEELGYVTTFWGRKRRLPEMQLPLYEFKYMPGHGDTDPLSFDGGVENLEVPEELQDKYWNMLKNAKFGRKRKIFEKINQEGVHVTDNETKIADATRQCVNSRIQGSAADMSKKAGIVISNCQELKDLGFKLLIPIHDEYLAECPKENAKKCAELFAKCMSDSAVDLGIPISCDVTITERWYGEEISV